MRKVLWYQLNLDKSNCICGSPAAGCARRVRKKSKKCPDRGTVFRAGHLGDVTAETPPPVQAAGDTIPKGLRS